jgi:hypothetical protein
MESKYHSSFSNSLSRLTGMESLDNKYVKSTIQSPVWIYFKNSALNWLNYIF